MPLSEANLEADLMAKALTQLCGSLRPDDAARVAQTVAAALGSGGNKLDKAQQATLSQLILHLESEVAGSLEMLGAYHDSTRGQFESFSTPTCSTMASLPELEEVSSDDQSSCSPARQMPRFPEQKPIFRQKDEGRGSRRRCKTSKAAQTSDSRTMRLHLSL